MTNFNHVCDNPSPPPLFHPPQINCNRIKRGETNRGGGKGEERGGAGTSQNTTAHPAYAIEQPERPVDGQSL